MKQKPKTFEQDEQARRQRYALRAYEVKTSRTEFFFNGDWRNLCRVLTSYGYKVPLSTCRDLWHGKEHAAAGPVMIKNLCYLFGTR